jgi:hypothetical protein
MRGSKNKKSSALLEDVFYIFIGIVIAIVFSRSGLVDQVYGVLGNSVLACFIAGIFFTSAFTIAPSSIFLVHIAQSLPLQTVALWGALGAVVGDLILFLFIRDKFAEDLLKSLKPSFTKHIFKSFHLGFLKWFSPILGAFIIASPLPDELGLTLMGLSKTRLYILIPISFIMNMIGIKAIVWFSHII